MSASCFLNNHTETAPCRSALEKWNSFPSVADTEMLYHFVNARPEDLFFFASSHAEAVQQVFWSVFIERCRKEGKCHLLTTCLEDAPTLLGLKRLEELGCFVKIAPCDQEGHINLAAFSDLINPRTALASVNWAQGLTGVVQPIEDLSRICREKGVLLHVDATYAAGKLPLHLDGIDYLTFSGDRIHGVKSSAALFAKAETPLLSLIPGKTIDFASLNALNTAAQQAQLSINLMGLEVARLRDRLEQGITQYIEGSFVLFSDVVPRLPNVTVIVVPRIHQETLLYALQRKNIDATIGGTIHSHLSRVLIASGIPERTAFSAISFSLSRYTTEQEIDTAITRFREAVYSLQTCAVDL